MPLVSSKLYLVWLELFKIPIYKLLAQTTLYKKRMNAVFMSTSLNLPHSLAMCKSLRFWNIDVLLTHCFCCLFRRRIYTVAMEKIARYRCVLLLLLLGYI